MLKIFLRIAPKNYTAPADGFYQVSLSPDVTNFGASTIANETRNMTIADNDMETDINKKTGYQYMTQIRIMPVLKGDTLRIYVNGKTVSNLKFIYAIGSEPNE